MNYIRYKDATVISKSLLELGALKFSVGEPFTYASGLKGPIYCDNRLITGDLKARKIIRNAFKNFIQETISNEKWNSNAVLGMATGAIAMGAWVSDDLNLPFGYIRSKPKGHGKGNIVEGVNSKHGPFIVLEDLINQGSSLVNGLSPLVKDFKIDGCFSVVNYGFEKAKKALGDLGIKTYCLTDYENLTQTACELGQITISELEELKLWHKNPEAWAKNR